MHSRRPASAEDVLSFKIVTDAQISPDGDLVAFVVGDPFVVDTKRPRSSIWVVPTDGGPPRQFTYGTRSDTTPRWHPEGQRLAFLSDRAEDGRIQIQLLPRSGGESAQLTSVEGDISASRCQDPIAWSPDGTQIAFLMADAETEQEKRRKKDKDDAVEVERNHRYTRLYVIDVENREVSCVSPPGLQVWEYCWSPGGSSFAAVVSDLPFERAWYTCRLAVLSIGGGSALTLHHSARQVAKPAWSPDGSLVAFLSSNWSDRGSTAGGVFVVPAAGGTARELSGDHVASATSVAWTDDGTQLLTTAHERGGVGIARIDATTGRRQSLWMRNAAFSEAKSTFSRDRSGNMAVVREDSTNPRDVWLARRGPDSVEWTQLTRLHPQAAELELGGTESVYWRGADAWEMHGFLIRPAGANDGGLHPMVTVVHGGPTGAHVDRYNPAYRWYQALAGMGIAVFLPNPRGSTGWGLEFAESNIGDMGGKDWGDILAGIDHCVDQGIADPDRLGIAGSSYGGFMTAWAVTQTDRFKAAVMVAGISDWRSFHGGSRISDWDSIHYAGADPWDPDGTYPRFSPITYVRRVSTPMLILHGEKDRDVPVDQSYLFYRALRDLSIETELVVYPRERHDFVEQAHILDANRRQIAWLTERL